MRSTKPIAFKWRHFHGEVILQCVRWYCKYGISYRDLEEMMREKPVLFANLVPHRSPAHKEPSQHLA
jgi:transposase-like protein